MPRKHPPPQETSQESQQRLFSLRSLLLVPVIAALVTVAFFAWGDIYKKFLEKNPPEIDILELPRGIGLSPVSLVFRARDADSGLDEVMVRIRQNGEIRDTRKIPAHGHETPPIPIHFDGQRSNLEEGRITVEIRAFDKSLWSSAAEKTIPLRVDFRRPAIEAISTQHNARTGGSQMIFYRAFDEALAISGVKIGNHIFPGYPARAIDRSFEEERTLYVAFYAIAADADPNTVNPRLFAEDLVGNAASAKFYNKVLPKRSRRARAAIGEDFLRGSISALADQNFDRLREINSKKGAQLQYTYRRGTTEHLLEKFTVVNDLLRELNANELTARLESRGYEQLWQGVFERPPGAIFSAFGDNLVYLYGNHEAGTAEQRGYTFLPSREQRNVPAMNGGIVLFTDDIGVFGKTVAVAHGLGLVSIYGRLGSATVSAGEVVAKRQTIGTVGQSGFSQGREVYVEMLVHGIPVDLNEWWDTSWYHAHIEQKINDVKRGLGIPITTLIR